ncbi:hypothetical protein O6H91_04G079600 [Diphasiastrum complanatum]|uniref:Uncharacterized protein n=1 Tax=Diphasiastrum complanatum TaxID=34168 RepID=A0ACC2DYL1_DIPCM|nr:hypothetical protein O6H91_04G079600 [Diphasiastrum complanatum]
MNLDEAAAAAAAAMERSNGEVKQFLEECRESGDKAYGAFKLVLERLCGNADSRTQARLLLSSVENYVNQQHSNLDCLATFHFKIHQISLTNFEGFRKNRQKLTLLELPSIFIPEDWSFTFFEGINRLSDSAFQDRVVAELGCGNGWVSIALAEKWSPEKVYGLDINPRAIKVAWINLYLNALNVDGSPVYDHEGKTLLDRVEFHVSDLLGYCKEKEIMLDRIIGCIPQVLNPDPDAMLKIVSENASEEFLYSLSNYCGLQGFVEDQFGLGLIARAVEEGIAVIKPNGAMIFNIGGRPGQAVCERLFKRRGFKITKLWQTRVKQAADTDILALVEIEKNSRHRFEFFMGLLSEEPICARTAWAYAKSGGEISHGLSVYQCQLQQPNEVKTIFRFLSSGNEEIRGALDLSFVEEAVAEEKIPFLAHLAQALEEYTYFPFELPAGSAKFRNLIAGFLRIYHCIPLTPTNFIVVPSRSVLIENILHLFSPQLALIEASLAKWLPKKWLTVLPHEELPTTKEMYYESGHAVVVLETPCRADLVMQLLKHLKPQVVITSLADFEMKTSTAFEQLIYESAQINARLFLDISDHVRLSSLPGTNGVLQYLAAHPLPPHVTIMCGLVKNQVYSDLEVAFMVSENEEFLHGMSKTVELIHGRTSVINQLYYGCLLHELLSFQLPNRHTTAQRPPSKEAPSGFIRFCESAVLAMDKAELSNFPLQPTDPIRMDLDENCLPFPSAIKMVVFEGFARQNISDSETDPRPEIMQFMTSKYGVSSSEKTTELILSDSCMSLFTKLVLACVQEEGTLFFITPSNGTYVSAAVFLQAKVKKIATQSVDGFKVTAKLLDEALKAEKKPWLYITGPTVNPTGMIYTNDEIHSILSVCQEHSARLIIDTSFSGLEYNSNSEESWDLSDVGFAACEKSRMAVALIGGFSTQLLTGGLEFGFAAVQDPVFIEALKGAPSLTKPHRTLNYTVKKLLGMAMQGSESSVILQGLSQQRALLQQRAQKLKQVLTDCGWDPVEPLAGVSLIARPAAYEGRIISYEDVHGVPRKVTLDSQNIKNAIFGVTQLCISSSFWTGHTPYCRFGFALQEDRFEQALELLHRFKAHP